MRSDALQKDGPKQRIVQHFRALQSAIGGMGQWAWECVGGIKEGHGKFLGH